MYTLYLDQKKEFNFELLVEGAKINKTQARLIINSDDFSMIFKGNVNEDGKVSITIPKLKNILQENQSGNMTLEVIAEDTYFTPWTEQYIGKINTKVDTKKQDNNSIISESQTKPSVTIKLNEQPIIDNDPIFESLIKTVKEKGITVENLPERINEVITLTNKFITIYGVSKEEFLNKVMNNLPEMI